ncbi:hypothetical protein DFJ43DRAFT_1136707 [Lentinula guzmanii]|uniref:Uncharacterized protein n=1 Tax=Lentinula guzmanii TaxID=2804957 RepID=A0AA38N3Y3_9AGAR|nr:hypothetical protein DFJ43DRAFT_1136707 [Lentinula guzmanii]
MPVQGLTGNIIMIFLIQPFWRTLTTPDIKIDSVRELVDRRDPRPKASIIFIPTLNAYIFLRTATSLLVPNRAFFQPGREHKFEAYQFTEVINKLKKKSKSTRTGTIGVPAHVIDLPKSKSDAYKIAFKLNTYPQPVHHQLGHRPDS